jgi:methylmalonyl-CoA/ethylmalonyl-CoA epimerase
MFTVKDFPLDHIGIAVNEIEAATSQYRRLADVRILAEDEVPSQMVKVRFIEVGHTKIELLEATSEDSPIARYIAKRGEGIHHIAFRVTDIYAQLARLKAEGFVLLQEKPILGALNKLIFFIHPKSMGGTLVEICQPSQEGSHG